MPNKSTESKLKAHIQQKNSPVPEHLWMQISQTLAQPATENKPKRKAYLWYSCAASLLLCAGLLGFLMPKKQSSSDVLLSQKSSKTQMQHKQNANDLGPTSLAPQAMHKSTNQGIEAQIWPEKPATSPEKTQPNAPVLLASKTTPGSLASSNTPQISTEKNKVDPRLLASVSDAKQEDYSRLEVKLKSKKITIDTDELSEENLPKTSTKHEKTLVDRSWESVQHQYEKINSVFTN